MVNCLPEITVAHKNQVTLSWLHVSYNINTHMNFSSYHGCDQTVNEEPFGYHRVLKLEAEQTDLLQVTHVWEQRKSTAANKTAICY